MKRWKLKWNIIECFNVSGTTLLSLAFRPHLAPSLNVLFSFCMLFIMSGGGPGRTFECPADKFEPVRLGNLATVTLQHFRQFPSAMDVLIQRLAVGILSYANLRAGGGRTFE